ncbi:receptor-type tyrosine-protein phosphatase kappa-like isoform X2 [Mya arenaria]|nr:receptor-type tyrosine-protein phosphatase kappa-like isoform X2 [Mya arenaria]
MSCPLGCDGPCNDDGTCSACTPNFEGARCDACIPGKYGENCSMNCNYQNCRCTDLNGCDSCKTGFAGTFCMKCEAAYYGANCNISCPTGCRGGTCMRNGACIECNTGYYGEQCNANCSKGCRDAVCHRNGTCACTDNFTGTKCIECVEDKYGDNCQHECSDGCSTLSCDKEDGSCVGGCKNGLYGMNCSQKCTDIENGCLKCSQLNGTCLVCKTGFYPSENGACTTCNGNCNNELCNAETGKCIKGCAEGFWGYKCDVRCSSYCGTCQQGSGVCDSCKDPTVHGLYCNESCNSSCYENKCDQGNGHCSNGCNGDFFGNMCQFNCPVNCQQRGVDTRCTADGICKFSCVDGYEGDDCSKAVKSQGAAIAGGVTGGVVVIIGVLVALFFFRRSKNKQNGNTTFKAYTADEENKEPNERTYYNEGQLKRESTNSNPAGTRSPANKPTSKELQTSAYIVTASEHEIDLEIDANHDEENTTDVYCNNSVALQNSKISVDVLVQFIDSLTEDDTRAVFEKFPQGLIKPYIHSQRSENMPRNRYKGIYPYDDSRVKFQDGHSDYINASFIDGYKKRKEYIATLGPMSQQLGDEFEPFWLMVWQQNVEKIVMVTNLIENASPKCEQYWPNVSTSKMYGEFKITCHSEDMYAEFTRRALTVTRSSEERTLYHLHFTCWPDKGIPDDVTALIEFRQRVLNTPTTYIGPTVVHCSAGVGRTGTYIALDILTKEGEAEQMVDIPACVANMRQNRPNMIQTCEQYQYLQKAVVYSLTFNCTPIKAEHFQQYMKTTKRTDLNRQFQQLQHTVEQRSKQEANAVKRNKQHLAKNRANADIPGDDNLPRLYLGLVTGSSDYINAVYIHSFKEKRRFLVVQTPLPETVTDFLTLVVQENCSCIVSFEPDMDKQRNVGIYYPAENMQVLQKGSFEISSSRETRKPYYAIKSLTIRHKRATGRPSEKTLSHMQFTEWDEMKNVPRSIEHFLTFLNDVEEKGNKDGPILLHCFDGAGRTGLFCVVSLLLQKMAIEHEVSVLNAVRKVKAMRRLAVPNLDQFIFCHESVLEFLRAFDKDVYANFAGSNE